jgi:hypothetical protein
MKVSIKSRQKQETIQPSVYPNQAFDTGPLMPEHSDIYAVNRHLTHCKKDMFYNPNYPTNRDYENLKFQNNNQIFNGRNLSDNTKVPNGLRRGTKENVKPSVWENGAITGHLLDYHYSDTCGIKVQKNPSNLVEAPRINEKYEYASTMPIKMASPFPQVRVPEHISTYGKNPNSTLYDYPVSKFAGDFVYNNVNNPYFMFAKDTSS